MPKVSLPGLHDLFPEFETSRPAPYSPAGSAGRRRGLSGSALPHLESLMLSSPLPLPRRFSEPKIWGLLRRYPSPPPAQGLVNLPPISTQTPEPTFVLPPSRTSRFTPPLPSKIHGLTDNHAPLGCDIIQLTPINALYATLPWALPPGAPLNNLAPPAPPRPTHRVLTSDAQAAALSPTARPATIAAKHVSPPARPTLAPSRPARATDAAKPGAIALPAATPARRPRTYARAACPPSEPAGAPAVSFDILRPDPAGSSLLHVASSTTRWTSIPALPPAPPPRTLALAQKPKAAAVALACERGTGADDRRMPPPLARGRLPKPSVPRPAPRAIAPRTSGAGVAPATSAPQPPLAAADGAGATRRRRKDGERKHVCKLCGKRFNRPSSLKIHSHTHSGARPFECPHAGCAKPFSVNSNMRRHYRTHFGEIMRAEADEGEGVDAEADAEMPGEAGAWGLRAPSWAPPSASESEDEDERDGYELDEEDEEMDIEEDKSEVEARIPVLQPADWGRRARARW